MKIATSLNICPTFLKETELLPRLASAGFDGADFNFCDLCERIDWHDEAVADAWVDTLGQAAAKVNIAWVQAHGPMFGMFSSEPKEELRRSLCRPCIRACGQLGVPWMVLHPETLPTGAADAAYHRESLAHNVAFFRDLLPYCEKHNVGIAIENMPEYIFGGTRRFGGIPEELIEMIDTLNHPLIGACWDTGHAKINKLEQRGAIAALGARLKVLHIQENDGKGDHHMLPLVNGNVGVNWQAVTAGLSDAGFTGAFTYEAHMSFRRMPPSLYDDVLRLAVKIARYLASEVEV